MILGSGGRNNNNNNPKIFCHILSTSIHPEALSKSCKHVISRAKTKNCILHAQNDKQMEKALLEVTSGGDNGDNSLMETK